MCRIFTSLALLVFLVASEGVPAFADEPSKAQELPADVAAALKAQARDMKTDDGSTVIEALRYAEQMRPNVFKLAGPFEFGYSEDGTLGSLYGCFFIGMKRLPDDTYCAIQWEVTKDHKSLVALLERTRENAMRYSTMYALMDGRDAFLREIDDMYHENCIDSKTGEKLC